MRRLPTFLIVGAMRSGTTTLVRWLGSHPDVFVARDKEIHFFDRHFDKGVDWYEAQFDQAGDALAVGEGTPRYMYDGLATQRMASTVPDAKLIATLRNPVDRAYSHYWHNVAKGTESLSFAESIAAEASRDEGDNAHYVDRGRYLSQLQRLCEYYPRERLHVVIFDDLREDPETTFVELCAFIGVDQHVSEMVGRPLNRYKAVRSARVRDAAEHLPRRARNLVGHLNKRMYPPMDRRLRAELVAGFMDDNAALSEWLDRDLSSWNR